MAYAGLADIPLHGFPVSALGTLSTTQQQSCLDTAAAEMDSYFRARYTLPFITFDVELVQRNVIIGKYNMMNLRGYNPQAGADKTIKDEYEKSVQWLADVRDQKIHPNVTVAATLNAVQPLVGSAARRGF